MPVAFVTNHVEGHESAYGTIYSAAKGIKSVTFLSYGSALDIVDLAHKLHHSTPKDVLVLDGPTDIAAIALNIWLELHKDAYVLRWSTSGWMQQRFSKAAIRKIIEQSRDEVTRG